MMSMSDVKPEPCSGNLVCRSPLKPGNEVKDIDADRISSQLVTISGPFATMNRILSRNTFSVA